MMVQKYIFVLRDGGVVDLPPLPDDSPFVAVKSGGDTAHPLHLKPNVIPALLAVQNAGYKLVILAPDDGMHAWHDMVMGVLKSQGIAYDCVLYSGDPKVCPPSITLLLNYVKSGALDFNNSAIIGGGQVAVEMADALAIQGFDTTQTDWLDITQPLVGQSRTATIHRKTRETDITVSVHLDKTGGSTIATGLGFFDHMLDQIATHGGIHLNIQTHGDLHIDDHHTIEDTAIALGQCLTQALGDKRGIARYAFTLPMDECLAQCALDLSGRSHLEFKGKFRRATVGDFSTEMTEHFFQSLSHAMACTLHLSVTGTNDHHKIESLFKVFARTLRQAIRIEGTDLPSSKGAL